MLVAYETNAWMDTTHVYILLNARCICAKCNLKLLSTHEHTACVQTEWDKGNEKVWLMREGNLTRLLKGVIITSFPIPIPNRAQIMLSHFIPKPNKNKGHSIPLTKQEPGSIQLGCVPLVPKPENSKIHIKSKLLLSI